VEGKASEVMRMTSKETLTIYRSKSSLKVPNKRSKSQRFKVLTDVYWQYPYNIIKTIKTIITCLFLSDLFSSTLDTC